MGGQMSNRTKEPIAYGIDIGRIGGDMTVVAKLYGGNLLDFATFKPPKYRKPREVHAQRARKLRRRGEYVHFLRWEHGHCIYCWGGPVPGTFYMRMPPR